MFRATVTAVPGHAGALDFNLNVETIILTRAHESVRLRPAQLTSVDDATKLWHLMCSAPQVEINKQGSDFCIHVLIRFERY